MEQTHNNKLDRVRVLAAAMANPLKAAGMEEQLAALRDRLDQETERPVTVLVCGEFKRGKSTFINALIGRRLCPTDTDICTSVSSIISYGETPSVTRYFGDLNNIQSEEISFDELEDYTVGTADEIDNTIYVDIRLPLESLKKGLTVIDTPGVGGLDPRHAMLTNFFLPRAEVGVFMTDCNEPLTEAELDFFKDRVKRYCRRSVVVINKIDLKGEGDVADITADTAAKLADRAGVTPDEVQCIPVSSVAELNPGVGYGESNFGALRAAIDGLAQAERDARTDLVAADLVELITLALNPLQAQLEQIEAPNPERINELMAQKDDYERRLVELNNPMSPFRLSIKQTLNSKREELLAYLNTASISLSSGELTALLEKARSMATDRAGAWLGRNINDKLGNLSSEVSLRLNEMFGQIAAMPQFGGSLNYKAPQYSASVSTHAPVTKLPMNKRIMSAMGGAGLVSMGIMGALSVVPVVGWIAAGVGVAVAAENMQQAQESNVEQQLRQIFIPQINAATSNLRLNVETRFQEFEQEWLRVLSERMQAYRDSSQEALRNIQEVKRDMAQATTNRVALQNKIKPLEKALEELNEI